MPPHILPAGAADPDGTGAGVGAGADTGGALAVVVLVGTRALADGVGCAEQLTRAVNDRNVTHTRTRFGRPMR